MSKHRKRMKRCTHAGLVTKTSNFLRWFGEKWVEIGRLLNIRVLGTCYVGKTGEKIQEVVWNGRKVVEGRRG